MRRVIIESPFSGDVALNLRYLRAAMRDCLLRGESPYASHALYTQTGVLDDNEPDERKHGIEAGFAWREGSHATIFYVDLGWSKGMEAGVAAGDRTPGLAKGRLQRSRSAGSVIGRSCLRGQMRGRRCSGSHPLMFGVSPSGYAITAIG